MGSSAKPAAGQAGGAVAAACKPIRRGALGNPRRTNQRQPTSVSRFRTTALHPTFINTTHSLARPCSLPSLCRPLGCSRRRNPADYYPAPEPPRPAPWPPPRRATSSSRCSSSASSTPRWSGPSSSPTSTSSPSSPHGPPPLGPTAERTSPGCVPSRSSTPVPRMLMPCRNGDTSSGRRCTPRSSRPCINLQTMPRAWGPSLSR